MDLTGYKRMVVSLSLKPSMHARLVELAKRDEVKLSTQLISMLEWAIPQYEHARGIYPQQATPIQQATPQPKPAPHPHLSEEDIRKGYTFRKL